MWSLFPGRGNRPFISISISPAKFFIAFIVIRTQTHAHTLSQVPASAYAPPISLWWVVVGIVNGGLPPFIRVELQVIRAKIITSQLCRPVMAMDLVGDGVMGIPCLTYYVYPLMALARDLLGIIITGDTFRAATMGDMYRYYAFIRGRVFNYVSSCGSCVGGSDGDSASDQLLKSFVANCKQQATLRTKKRFVLTPLN